MRRASVRSKALALILCSNVDCSKPNNLIKRSDKDGCMCIDYDFSHASCAQQVYGAYVHSLRYSWCACLAWLTDAGAIVCLLKMARPQVSAV